MRSKVSSSNSLPRETAIEILALRFSQINVLSRSWGKADGFFFFFTIPLCPRISFTVKDLSVDLWASSEITVLIIVVFTDFA